ncbi:unnamed protein product [Brassica napus]|uniref:(rape) hypothetical protein n=1 Tax=Brassica napus TaxID=3708 RepID=A0A816WNS3_BRANA|nr:unnamed protein product [Brassica napus]
MVILGAWASVGSLWEFVIDKKNMTRIVHVWSGMSLWNYKTMWRRSSSLSRTHLLSPN